MTGLESLRDVGQVLAGLKEGKGKEYTVVAILGGRESGKTALVNRFIRNAWEPTVTTRRFMDIQSASLDVRGTRVQVVTCEYAGSSEYRLVQKTMFPPTKSAPVRCMLTIDLSRKESQNELIEIVDSLVVPRLGGKFQPLSYLLVGCKADLKVGASPSEIGGLSRSLSEKLRKQVGFVETSAKEGKNVEEAFRQVVA